MDDFKMCWIVLVQKNVYKSIILQEGRSDIPNAFGILYRQLIHNVVKLFTKIVFV